MPPSVTVTIDDPGYGLSSLQAAVGAYQVDVQGFRVLYKCNNYRAGTILYSWTAIGRWR